MGKNIIPLFEDFPDQENPIQWGDVKTLNFPELRQMSNFSCGASALQSILQYYGIEKREDDLAKEVNATEYYGTHLEDIKRVAEYYGLVCDVLFDMTIEKLKENLDKGIPVMISLQAYKADSKIDWPDRWDDGHFVVAIGYDNEKVIFEDPSVTCRTFLGNDELMDRWHDVDDNGNQRQGIGIVIYGLDPVYDIHAIKHMD